MKKILFLAALAAAAVSAGAQVSYSVKGTAKPGKKSVCLVNLGQGSAGLDTVQVADGRFELSGQADKDALLGLCHVGDEQLLMFFNDGTPLNADLSTGRLRGSEQNNRLNDYDRRIDSLSNVLQTGMMELQFRKMGLQSESAQQQLTDSLMQVLKPAQDQLLALFDEVIDGNRDNLIPAAFISSLASAFDYDELKEALDPKYAYASHPATEGAKRYLASLEAKQRIVGTPFTDLEENDLSGTPRRLSEFCGRGNYVLIDFWASWCAPCRQEMPNVVAAYEKYHDKGFNIVGLSLDQKAEAWKKAIIDLKMPWVHLSDLKGWSSVAAKTYNIRSIPASLLVDPEGKIVATDLRGSQLGEKLSQIYGF